jgi:hypothetical protein
MGDCHEVDAGAALPLVVGYLVAVQIAPSAGLAMAHMPMDPATRQMAFLRDSDLMMTPD